MTTPSVLLATLLLLLTPPDDALKELKAAFRPSRNPAAVQERRSRALERIAGGGHESPALARALIEATLQLRKEIAPVEERRRDWLSGKRSDKELKLRVHLDPLRDLEERIRTILLKLNDPATRAAAVEAALEKEKLALTLRLDLAGRMDARGEKACDRIAPLLKRTRKPGEMLVALEAARALGKEVAPLGKPVIAGLRHKSAAVREAAAAALAALCVPASLEPLVDRLAVEEGRTRDRIADALQVLTCQAFGPSERLWRRWLREEGKEYVDGSVPLGGGEIRRITSAESKYHEIPIDGLSILYIFDCSLSMNQPMEGKKAREKNPDVVGEETRFDRARTELLRALRTLPPYKTFNILLFETRCRPFSEKMVPASPDRIKEACAWIESAKRRFGTQLYDALDRSFELAGRGIEDRFYDASVDTIFVLTDGVPYIGNKPDPFGRIRDAVRRWNLNRRVVIHVIGLGDDVQAKRLRRFAEENGGKFVHEKSR